MKKNRILLLSLIMLASCSKIEPDDKSSGVGNPKSSSSSCLCGATTQAGKTCNRKVADCTRCWQHK